MKIKMDLHTHTTASDGKLSPEELINLALEEGLDVIAITDHDTTNGVERAFNAKFSEKLRIIPGIELSTIHNNESIHILGYFRDESYKNKDFQQFLKDAQDFRVFRAKKIIDNLKIYFDIELDYDEVFKRARGVIARPHIAYSIIEKGYPYTWDYIFDKIIGKNSPAYVHNKKVSLQEGIDILTNLNAIVSLAHPKLIKHSKVEELMSYKFHGIEAIYYLNTPEEQEKFMALANDHNKIVTCGSDFHGNGKEDTRHGFLGAVNMPLNLAEIFLKNINNL